MYSMLIQLIWRLMCEDDRSKRIIYSKRALNIIEELNHKAKNQEIFMNDMSEKLIRASRQIRRNEEWAECLIEAADDYRLNILTRAHNLLKDKIKGD